MGWLLLLFVALPLVDIWILLRIGGAIGFANTVLVVLAAALLGAWLAKSQGVRVMREWQQAMAAGRLPEEGALSGALVLAGGLLLVMPGIVTDALGILLLLPPTRRLAAAGLGRWLRRRLAEGKIHVVTRGGPGGPPPPDEPIDVTPRGGPRR